MRSLWAARSAALQCWRQQACRGAVPMWLAVRPPPFTQLRSTSPAGHRHHGADGRTGLLRIALLWVPLSGTDTWLWVVVLARLPTKCQGCCTLRLYRLLHLLHVHWVPPPCTVHVG